jgi:hypothetical protein
MQVYRDIDGIKGQIKIRLVEGETTDRIRLEHVVTPDLPAQELPKFKYLPRRIAGLVFPTRIIEFVDVPKGKFVPCGVAQDLVRKHLGNAYTVSWVGRGWWIEAA